MGNNGSSLFPCQVSEAHRSRPLRGQAQGHPLQMGGLRGGDTLAGAAGGSWEQADGAHLPLSSVSPGGWISLSHNLLTHSLGTHSFIMIDEVSHKTHHRIHQQPERHGLGAPYTASRSLPPRYDLKQERKLYAQTL